MNSATQICNMALSRLGSKETVNSITDPTKAEERICAVWYDPCRQSVLKKLMPNCALARKIVAKLSFTPAFGYAYAYQYPIDCLKVLGIGAIQDKENNYAVEGNMILTDEDYEDGMELRYIKDLTDVSKMPVEVCIAISAEMMEKIALQITQDAEKLKAANAFIKIDQGSASALNGQENRPVRINRSLFKLARQYDNPSTFNKR